MQFDSERDAAWIGDAILALFARSWILQNPLPAQLSRREVFTRFTANEFLASFGEPTAVEATIGRIYAEQGLQPAFQWIEDNLLPSARNFVLRHNIRSPGKRPRRIHS